MQSPSKLNSPAYSNLAGSSSLHDSPGGSGFAPRGEDAVDAAEVRAAQLTPEQLTPTVTF